MGMSTNLQIIGCLQSRLVSNVKRKTATWCQSQVKQKASYCGMWSVEFPVKQMFREHSRIFVFNQNFGLHSGIKQTSRFFLDRPESGSRQNSSVGIKGAPPTTHTLLHCVIPAFAHTHEQTYTHPHPQLWSLNSSPTLKRNLQFRSLFCVS